MRALHIKELGGPLEPTEIAVPTPGRALEAQAPVGALEGVHQMADLQLSQTAKSQANALRYLPRSNRGPTRENADQAQVVRYGCCTLLLHSPPVVDASRL